MRKLLILGVLLAAPGFGQLPELTRARELYQKTSYEEALDLLDGIPAKSAPVHALMGKCHYMRGDFKKASESFEQAARLEPAIGDHYLWLGRAYGRRAETSSFFTAPALASKARQNFEKAVALNPRDTEAVADLFEYYLEAPGVMGGGMEKARALAEQTKDLDQAEYHYRLAQIADKKKEFRDAEEQLRRAAELAPRQAGRIVDLARYLAKQGQYQQSDAAFRQAEQVAPESPRVMFERAKAYIRAGRNLDAARDLLVRYLNSNLTPDDPPRSEAERLLKQVQSG
jgi:tetratricopeptide (TPR) repeat protein